MGERKRDRRLRDRTRSTSDIVYTGGVVRKKTEPESGRRRSTTPTSGVDLSTHRPRDPLLDGPKPLLFIFHPERATVRDVTSG